MKICRISVTAILITVIAGFFSFHSYSESSDKAAAIFTELSSRQDFYSLSGGQAIDNFDDEQWVLLKNGKITYNSSVNSSNTLLVNAASASDRIINFMREFEPVQIMSSTDLRFGITVSGEAGASYNISVVLSGEGYTKEYTARLKNDLCYEIILSLTEFKCDALTGIEILAEGENSFISNVKLTPIRISEEYQKSLYENFSAYSISGDFMYSKDNSYLSLEDIKDKSSVSLRSSLIYDSDLMCSGGGVIALEIDSNTAGTVSLNIEDNTSSKSSSYSCGTQTIANDKKYYFFRFSPCSALTEYQITITSELSEDSRIDIKSVKLYLHSGADIEYNRAYGSIPKINLNKEENSLTIEGNLTRQSIIDNIDGNILVFKVPMWQKDSEALTSEPYLSMRVSSKYQFKIPLEQAPDALLSRYIVAVSRNDEITPVYKSQYPSVPQKNAEAEYKTIIASSGMNEKDYVKSGCDRIYIKLSLEELNEGGNSNSSTLVSWNKKYYYLNSDIMRDLSSKLSFFRSSKTEIYISFTDPADYFCNISEDNFTYIFAVCGYLLDNYSFISGFAISDGLNISVSEAFGNASLSSEISGYISSYAETLHAIYALGASKSDSFNIEAKIKSEAGYELSGFILSEKMSEIGSTSWALIFAPDAAEASDANMFSSESLTKTRLLCSYIREIQNSGFRGMTLSYSISYRDIAERYQELSDLVVENSFLSLYFEFTETDTDAPLFYLSDNGAVYDSLSFTPKSEVLLWDFSSSYSTYGWITDNTSRLSSTTNKLKNNETPRVMHAFISSSGLMLYSFDKAVDFSDAPYFCLKGFTDEVSTFTVIFISNDKSIAFECSTKNGMFTKYLDMSELAGASDITAIAIYSDSGVSVSFSGMGILSKTKTEDEIRELITINEIKDSENGIKDSKDFESLLRLSILTVCVSMAALIFLSRHKREKSL